MKHLLFQKEKKLNSLKERLKSDLKEAMKNRENFRRDTIRFLMSAIKQVEVDERKELSDEEIYKIIQKSIKQREDAAKQYKEAGREDLFEKEETEARILKRYLPEQLSDEKLEKIVEETIAQIGATSMKDMGKVVKATLEKTGPGADGKRVSEKVKKLLNIKKG